ncbi:hypothetical protein Tco_1527222, partial [Tanacetum coccineum]
MLVVTWHEPMQLMKSLLDFIRDIFKMLVYFTFPYFSHMSSGACDFLSQNGDGRPRFGISCPHTLSDGSKYFMARDDVDTLSLELEPESVHLG